MNRPAMTKYEFFRPVLFAMGVSVATVLVCRYVLELPTHRGFDDLEVMSLELPRPNLSPREVVHHQVLGLMSQRESELGVLQCYCFAAPSNRLVTGPYRRFATMVRLSPWDRLGSCQSFTVGDEIREGERARVLVSTVGEDRKLFVFSFVLERQVEPPFRDCWMTVGVFVVLPKDGILPMESGAGGLETVERSRQSGLLHPHPSILRNNG